MSRQPRFSYVVAVLLGLFAAFLPASLPLENPSFTTSLLISTAVFGVVGLVLGLLWPRGGWRWGLWVVAPGALLVTLVLVLSGGFETFLGDDLPFLVTGVVGACFGGVMGARWSPRGSLPSVEESPR